MRDIVRIDSETCIGCGKCAEACAEGAIKMVAGKAVLVNDAHCDGLGACLPSCPVNAISIEKRDATPFIDPESSNGHSNAIHTGGIPMAACPGSASRTIKQDCSNEPVGTVPSRLSHWPIQLRLMPTIAPHLNDCDLLIAADCTAFAYGNFHDRFIKGHKIVIGCPKLDPRECWSKLKDLISMNNIKSITVTRMDVPCCSGIVNATLEAVSASGKDIPVKIYTIFGNGNVIENQ